MTSVNLTRDEAAKRSQLVTAHHYDVHLDLTASEEYFVSTTTATFRAHAKDSTFIDLRAGELVDVRLNGNPLPTNAYNPTYGIPLSGLQEMDYELKVTAKIPFSRTGEGLHRFVDPADGKTYLYTQFEAADAKRVFACFDQPDMKATYDLAFTVPDDWKVITNSPVTWDGATARAKVDYPLSTYLIAVCAGPYHEETTTWSGELTHHPETPEGQPEAVEVPLGIYCRQSLADHLDYERLFTETKQGFDFYHRNFGYAYPYGKYDQIFVPEFNAGAMENAGCVTIRDEYVFTSQATHYRYERRADTILHELAHMWFGDLVTMRWWDDLWLNESFATWSAAISQAEETEYDTAWVTFANVEKSWAYQQDQLPTTHPISTDATDIETVEQNFDGITYAKGASVLKQLQAYVGRENFFAGVRRHFAAHQWDNASFSDLLGHLEDASGRDLSFWAQQWLKTTGVNTLAAKFNVADDGTYSDFGIKQYGDTLRTHRIAVGLYRLEGDTVRRYQQVELDISGEATSVPQLNGVAAADMVLVNDDDLTYCLQDLDTASLRFATENIDKIADPMARTLIWSAAWEMTRAGTMRARDFVALVARGAQAETERAVLERILMQATTALTNYADPQWAEVTGWGQLADALLDGAEHSRDAESQLIFTQALTKVHLNDAARTFLQDKLASSEDNDLRWRAIAALVADGSLGDPEATIAAEEQRDNTASGRQAALRARATENTDANKKQVWEEIFSGELSNLELRHKLEGLTYPGSTEHLLPLAPDYFERAEKMWSNAAGEVALTTVTGAYPRWDVSEEALTRADEFLRRDLPGGLRRVVTEQRDRTARALRNRAVDANGTNSHDAEK